MQNRRWLKGGNITESNDFLTITFKANIERNIVFVIGPYILYFLKRETYFVNKAFSEKGN